jgi:ABC-type multidrug transport system fused ATPase/permease subunit
MFSLGVNMITATGTAAVLGFGAWHVLDKKLTPGELLVIMSYIAAVYTPLEEISRTFAGLQQMFISVQMAFVLLDTEPEIMDAPDAIDIDRAEGRVTFEYVNFKHAGRRRRTLKKISFDVPPRTRVGIVGATGAGKTTLVNLMPRFYDPEIGRILLDGIDIKGISLRSLRAQIAIVHQSPLLFSGPIRDNIRDGRLNATEEEVVEAATAANAHAFIAALPDGYGTSLGEGGSLLSGGERQRISIARAFLKDAPILILDEPTASIDSHTEAVILEALDRLAEHRTTFTIAHRLSTLGRSDMILVIDRGRLVEQGTHAELMANSGGLYRRTYELQSRPSLRVAPATPAEIKPVPPAYAGPVEPLIEALRLLLEAQPADLDVISTKPGEPIEIRLAAGILGVLSREDRLLLRTLDDAKLVALLEEVRT